MQRARPSVAERPQGGQVDKPVSVFAKTILAIIATLPNVQRYARESYAVMARHDDTTAAAARG